MVVARVTDVVLVVCYSVTESGFWLACGCGQLAQICLWATCYCKQIDSTIILAKIITLLKVTIVLIHVANVKCTSLVPLVEGYHPDINSLSLLVCRVV